MKRPARAIVACLGLSLGCEGKAISDGDCLAVGEHMRAVWLAELSPPRPATVDAARADALYREQGDRLQAEWTRVCRAEFVGRRASNDELQCILKASSAKAITACQSRAQ